MKQMWVLVVFVAVKPVLAAWTCDQGKELASVKKEQMTGRDSRPFMHALNVRYEQHVTPMRAFEVAHPGAKPNAYLETEAGKKTAFKLKDIKEGFNYDAASEYLLGEPLGDHPANPERVDYTHIYKKGKRLFYLDGDRLVATRLMVNNSEYLLKIFNSDCSLREIVSLPTLELGTDKYEYKINGEYCSQLSGKAPTRIDADAQDGMKIFLPDEQEDIDKLKSRLTRDCQQWAPASFAKKASGTNSSKSRSTK
jgi:hypothetical protein